MCVLMWTADEASAAADPGSQESSEQPDEPAAKKHKTQESVALHLSINVRRVLQDMYFLIGTDSLCTSLLSQTSDFFHWERRLIWSVLWCVLFALGVKSCVLCVCAGLRSLWRQNQLRALNIRAQILQVGRISPD